MLVQIKSPSRLTSFSSWDVAQGQIGQDHHHYNGCAVQELEGQEHHIEECSQQEDLVITHLKDVQIFKGSPRSVSRRNKLDCSSYIMIKFLLTSEATKNSVKLPLFHFIFIHFISLSFSLFLSGLVNTRSNVIYELCYWYGNKKAYVQIMICWMEPERLETSKQHLPRAVDEMTKLENQLTFLCHLPYWP